MISFFLSLFVLVIGGLFYIKFLEKIFQPDHNRVTPAVAKADGTDYVVMPSWKIFMIQFLNIAGTGPIFGAILGAKYGPACYLWIVLGCMFGGIMHDYLSGMLSIRHDGESLPNLIGHYLGKPMKKLMLNVLIVMLALVGVVFVYSPAAILGSAFGDGSVQTMMVWTIIILIYYFIATMVPIDKIIGRIYPLFAFALVFMAVSLLVCLLIHGSSGMPEITDGLQNRSPSLGPIFPCLFISVACGAISGFHATQSPMMARCMKSERIGSMVFGGSMLTEGVIALIWAAISSYFFYDGGNVVMNAENVVEAPVIVNTVSKYWLGTFGGLLAILGVVAAPITTGDTALRALRLMIAESLDIDQCKISHRLFISMPIFVIVGLLLWFNYECKLGFDMIWQYFGWINQVLAVITLWMLTLFLFGYRKRPYYLIALFPACFMTSVCVTFILVSNNGVGLPVNYASAIGVATFFVALIIFWRVVVFRRSKAQ